MEDESVIKQIPLTKFTGNLFLLANSKDKYRAFSSFMEEESGELTFIIMLNFGHKKGITHEVIAHEISHTVDNILETHGEVRTGAVDEESAKWSGWVASEVYKFTRENNFEVLFEDKIVPKKTKSV